jgi:predicted AAA+ superfamily ATPase
MFNVYYTCTQDKIGYMIDLKTIIIDGQERVDNISVLSRDIVFDLTIIMKLGKIVTITGPRRAGKTSFMFQMMKLLGLRKEEIVVLDFSDILLSEFTTNDFPKLLDAYYSIYPDLTPWFFLDEIQEVDFFEGGLKTLLNHGCKITITGSSAKLFSSDIASTLRGKGLTLKIMPLDFKEYLRFRNMHISSPLSSKGKGQYATEFNRFLSFGGFPEVVLTESPETRRTLLKSYMEIMLLRDVIERNDLHSGHLAEKLLLKTMNSFTKELSVNKWFNDLRSEGVSASKDTLFKLLHHFEDTQFIHLLQNIAGGSTSQKKVYMADNGLFTPFRSLSPDSGRLFENLVFLDLKRIDSPLHFLKLQNSECDFIVGETAVQCCYRLTSENWNREVAGLKLALNYPGIRHGILVYSEIAIPEKLITSLPKNCEMKNYFEFVRGL